MKGGFLFKIIEEQLDNWETDYRCRPDGSEIDCGAIVLSFLGVPYDISVELQTMSNKQGGLTTEQLVLALSKLDKTDFESVTRLEDVNTKEFSNGKELFQFVQDEIPPEYAAIVIGDRSETIGHFFIIFKDSNSEIFILDPQASLFFSRTTEPTIDEYLSTFDGGLYILLGKTCELSKFNNLYKTYKSKDTFEMDGGKKKPKNQKPKNQKPKTKKSKTKKSKTKKSKTKKSKTKKSKTRKTRTKK